ncbi:MAG: hypothetical protein V4677_10845 [Bacteroidota bacterium]
MKKHLLKYLIALNFLILAMPFFQTCSDNDIIFEKAQENVLKGNTKTLSIEAREQMITASKENGTLNGYQLFYNAAETLQFECFNDLLPIPSILIPVLNLALFIVSFRKNQKIISYLSLINLTCTILEFIALSSSSDDIYQIKYGMYLLLTNSVVILYISVKTFSTVHYQRNPIPVY